ncbi:hypothetical protein GGR56DRAFT_676895 [Xylariaceae sp. FL0804]|nr:hypothetical protein GGR56DRAFT_676895 [Xylariaceae sp. FL0804]
MQFKTAVLALFAAVAVSADSVSELVGELPSCSAPCLKSAAKAIGCAYTDVECQCADPTGLQKNALVCIQKSCTSQEISQILKVSSQICEAAESSSSNSTSSNSTSSASSNSTASATNSSGTGVATGAAIQAAAGMGFVGVAALFAIAV